jgi:hypothetical protein
METRPPYLEIERSYIPEAWCKYKLFLKKITQYPANIHKAGLDRERMMVRSKE